MYLFWFTSLFSPDLKCLFWFLLLVDLTVPWFQVFPLSSSQPLKFVIWTSEHSDLKILIKFLIVLRLLEFYGPEITISATNPVEVSFFGLMNQYLSWDHNVANFSVTMTNISFHNSGTMSVYSGFHQVFHVVMHPQLLFRRFNFLFWRNNPLLQWRNSLGFVFCSLSLL